MHFIYAKKLKELFDVYGHFYDLQLGSKIFKCRSILEIVLKEVDYKKKGLPDAVVIMMNPGSSRPLDKSYTPKLFNLDDVYSNKWKKEIIPTRPDNAQYQLMRLMLLNDWKYVKVLNLSDLRNGNSSEFAKEFKKLAEIDSTHPHCMVHPERRKELKLELKTVNGTPPITAWGALEVLRNSAEEMIKIIPGNLGLETNRPWYRYPSPYIKEQKLSWLSEMDRMIKSKSE